jgi:predicted O-methyltransferase YrrM
VLPRGVAQFQWRARRFAWRTGDTFSLVSATRPEDLRILLELAAGRRRVVELGTASGWTAISLALADPTRQVVTYDPIQRPEPERYLALVGADVRERIERIAAPGSEGPRNGAPVDLLYIDSAHDRAGTIAEVDAWRAALGPGSLIVFDDFTHPDFPGVREAVEDLELDGVAQGTLFVHAVA